MEINQETLDVLKEATDTWADEEVARLESETEFLQGVLEKRGIEKASSIATRDLQSQIEAEVQKYMNGGN